MPKKKAIPDEVRRQVQEIIDRFNEEELNSPTPICTELHERNLERAASPPSLLERIGSIFSRRNQEEFINYKFYSPRYHGKYLYLDRHTPFMRGPVCRLTYNGSMTKWDFAIYKASSGKYAPDEWFFPGDQYVNGTIEGAMRASMEAYPV
ncbi:MAG: hypothetical protein AAF702_08665 [Chloroflexota bacterium]